MNICGILFWGFIIFSIVWSWFPKSGGEDPISDGEGPKSDGDGLHWADLTQVISVILLVGLALIINRAFGGTFI